MKLKFSEGLKLSDEIRGELEKLFAANAGVFRVTVREGEVNRYERKGDAFAMTVRERSAIVRGLLLLARSEGDFVREETRVFRDLGVMLDCSRNAVYTADAVKRLIRILAALGYNSLQLYTEDTYEVTDEPYFGYLRGRYTKEEIREIDRYAAEWGVELVPCIQTLAHLNAIFRWAPYALINDTADILLLEDDRTYELIENMFKTLAECFTSRRVNVGMDEAHMIGRGKYLDLHGLRSRPEIMRAHVKRVTEIAAKYGFSCMMWSDMFFRLAFGGDYYNYKGEMPEEVRRSVPDNLTLVYWDYYNTEYETYDGMIKKHLEFGAPVSFAGGAWMWKGFSPSNRFSLRSSEPALRACAANGIERAFITMWGDNGAECSPFMLLPALAFDAELSFGGGEVEAKKDVAALTGLTFDDFLALDDPDLVFEKNEGFVSNPSKYLLYNDPLLGAMDGGVEEGLGAKYARVAERLEKCATDAEWGYLFESQRALCAALEIKAEIGVKARKLYAAGNRAGMARFVGDAFTPLLDRTEAFYAAFLAAWNRDKKPHGFDVQDIRLGGLIRRLRHASAVLWDWAAGKSEKIPEFEERILDVRGSGEPREITGLCFNSHMQIASQNVF